MDLLNDIDMTNPYQSPDPSPDPTLGFLTARRLFALAIFAFTTVSCFLIGQHCLQTAEISDFPSWDLSFAFVAFPVLFLVKQTTTFGIYFCKILSCVLWGLLLTTVYSWFAILRKTSKDE